MLHFSPDTILSNLLCLYIYNWFIYRHDCEYDQLYGELEIIPRFGGKPRIFSVRITALRAQSRS